VPDAHLLQRWIASRDEAAFELLLWRHGPTVFGVCRRMLDRSQDIEDAFQATFLVLVQKAHSVHKCEALGSWLYKVAFRIALRIKGRAAKQPLGLVQDFDLPSPERPDELLWQDVRSVLDEEINRLSERYRTTFILSYLEGKTNEEVARVLGVPIGTIQSRLARARHRLQTRLARRGLTLSLAMLTAALVREAVAAIPPPSLIGSTLRTALLGTARQAAVAGALSAQAAALTQGFLRAIWVRRIQWITVVALIPAVFGGTSLIAYQMLAAARGASPTETAPLAVTSPAHTSLARQQERAEPATVPQTKELAEHHDKDPPKSAKPRGVQSSAKETLKKIERERRELQQKLEQIEAWSRETRARLEKLKGAAADKQLAILEQSLRQLLADLAELRRELLRQEDALVPSALGSGSAVKK
jgi:RNA polymerase sigma factor (sigma-70 family)